MGQPAPTPPHRSVGADPHGAIVDFLDRCRQTMATLAAELEPDAPERAGVETLAAAVAGATPVEFEPSWVPVLDTVDRLGRDAGEPGRSAESGGELVERFDALARRLPWIPTYRATDEGTELALAPLDRALDLGDTTVGLMYVGPGCTYPLHQHPPQELYLTIAGTGRWRYGGRTQPEEVRPPRLLYNNPDDLHTSTAGDHPLLALYVLW